MKLYMLIRNPRQLPALSKRIVHGTARPTKYISHATSTKIRCRSSRIGWVALAAGQGCPWPDMASRLSRPRLCFRGLVTAKRNWLHRTQRRQEHGVEARCVQVPPQAHSNSGRWGRTCYTNFISAAAVIVLHSSRYPHPRIEPRLVGYLFLQAATGHLSEKIVRLPFEPAKTKCAFHTRLSSSGRY